MARINKTTGSVDSSPSLRVSRDEARKRLQERVAVGEEIIKKIEPVLRGAGNLKEIRSEYYSWSEFNTDLLGSLFNNDKYKEEYSASAPMFFSEREQSLYEKAMELKNDVERHIRKIRSISDRLELVPELPATSRESVDAGVVATSQSNNKIFVVHGQNELKKQELARFIEKGGLTAVILHEQANHGSSTIIEKFERNSDVSAAIVLITGDDEARRQGTDDTLSPRARQNVVFELGYFIAKLGLKRVVALYESRVEIPSDFSGVLYIPMDSNGAWKMNIAKEFREMGIVFDLQSAI